MVVALGINLLILHYSKNSRNPQGLTDSFMEALWLARAFTRLSKVEIANLGRTGLSVCAPQQVRVLLKEPWPSKLNQGIARTG